MNNDKFVIPNFEQPKQEKKHGLNTLLKLSELRKKQILTGEKIKGLREDLIKERENLKDISEAINKLLDGIK